MNRSIRTFAVGLLVIALLPIVAYFAGIRVQLPLPTDGRIVLTASAVALQPGDQTTVQITTRGLSDPIAAAALTLAYDPALLRPVSGTPVAGATCTQQQAEDELAVACLNLSSNGQDSIVQVTFELLQAGRADVTLRRWALQAADGRRLVANADTRRLSVVSHMPADARPALLADRYGPVWHAAGGPQLARPADGDAITLSASSVLTQGQRLVVDANVDSAGYLAGWFDWNRDGRFDPVSERAIAQSVTAGPNQLSLFVPNAYGSGTLAARFRLYHAQPARLHPLGGATGGDSVDYLWRLAPQAVPTTPLAERTDSDTTFWLALSVLALTGAGLWLAGHTPASDRRRWRSDSVTAAARYQNIQRTMSGLLGGIMVFEGFAPALLPAYAFSTSHLQTRAPAGPSLAERFFAPVERDPACDLYDIDCNGYLEAADVDTRPGRLAMSHGGQLLSAASRH